MVTSWTLVVERRSLDLETSLYLECKNIFCETGKKILKRNLRKTMGNYSNIESLGWQTMTVSFSTSCHCWYLWAAKANLMKAASWFYVSFDFCIIKYVHGLSYCMLVSCNWLQLWPTLVTGQPKVKLQPFYFLFSIAWDRVRISVSFL